jgi:steroid delta-isomerase-like uncharacterized protein
MMDRRTFLTTGLAAGTVAASASSFGAESAPEGNKAVARRFTEVVWGAHNAAVLEELLSPGFVNHDPFPGTEGNIDGERQALAIHSAALGESEATADDQIAEGDKVATRWTFCGTHKGEFLGIAATGKRIKITGINICRIENGKIVELWREVDIMGVLRQLGAAPPIPEKK